MALSIEEFQKQFQELVAREVKKITGNVDDAMEQAVVDTYKRHNKDFTCTCDYCVALRRAAEDVLSKRSALDDLRLQVDKDSNPFGSSDV